MHAVNDALADQIIRASITGGPGAAGRYLLPTAARPLAATSRGWLPAALAAIRALPGRLAALIAVPTDAACCEAA